MKLTKSSQLFVVAVGLITFSSLSIAHADAGGSSGGGTPNMTQPGITVSFQNPTAAESGPNCNPNQISFTSEKTDQTSCENAQAVLNSINSDDFVITGFCEKNKLQVQAIRADGGQHSNAGMSSFYEAGILATYQTLQSPCGAIVITVIGSTPMGGISNNFDYDSFGARVIYTGNQ